MLWVNVKQSFVVMDMGYNHYISRTSGSDGCPKANKPQIVKLSSNVKLPEGILYVDQYVTYLFAMGKHTYHPRYYSVMCFFHMRVSEFLDSQIRLRQVNEQLGTVKHVTIIVVKNMGR